MKKQITGIETPPPFSKNDTIEIADIEEHVSKELSGLGRYTMRDMIKMILFSPLKKMARRKS